MNPETTAAVRRYIGKRIKYARNLADQSQEQLAKQLSNYTGQKFSREIVANFEGGRRAISVELLCAIAAVQGRAVGWYFADAPDSLADAIPGLRGLLDDGLAENNVPTANVHYLQAA